jgi:secretion/DNA translocation related CpaE-like protein
VPRTPSVPVATTPEPRPPSGSRSGHEVGPPTDPRERPPVVLLSRDQALVDHVTALADAAGVALLVRGSPAGPGRQARLTLVGPDVAADLPRGHHGGVLVVRVDGADPPDGVWRRAVEMGADHVALLPEAEAWLIEELLEAAAPVRRAPVIGLLPGAGGAGASTLAVALAVIAARRGLQTVLLDADPLSGGLDLPLGLESAPGLRWPDVPPGPGRWPAGLLGAALPEIAGVRVLTCARDDAVPLRGPTAGAAVDAAAREADLVVLDLPRPVGEVGQEVLPRCARVLLVAPAEVRGAAAAAAAATNASLLARDLRLIVRTRCPGGPTPQALADGLGLPLAGRLAWDARLAAVMERGEAAALARRGALPDLCRSLLGDALEPW